MMTQGYFEPWQKARNFNKKLTITDKAANSVSNKKRRTKTAIDCGRALNWQAFR